MDERISEDRLLGSDLDWFAYGGSGIVAHLVTAGTNRLPTFVADSDSRRVALLHYFRRLPATTSIRRVYNASHLRLRWALDAFYSSFEEMASRGLHSFQAYVDPLGRINYRLIVSPDRPLTASMLEPKIRSALPSLDVVFEADFVLE